MKASLLVRSALIAGLFCSSGELQSAPEPSLSTFAVPGADLTWATGITNRGDVVGFYQAGSAQHGFVRSKGQLTAVDFPGSRGTTVWGTTGSGDLVGTFDTESGGGGFVFQKGAYIALSPSQLTPRGINSRGEIVGLWGDHGFLLSGGVLQQLDYPGAVRTFATGINDGGVIVGFYSTGGFEADGTHGFVYRDGVFTGIDFPGSVFTQALGINAGGEIVGYYGLNGLFGFTLRQDRYESIGPGLVATGVNARGDIVGLYQIGAGGAFVLSR